jgi:hypothetical protein
MTHLFFVNNPEQVCVNVLRAITTVESCRGMRVAEKTLDILCALSPLYTEESPSDICKNPEHNKQDTHRAQTPFVDFPNVPIGAIEVKSRNAPYRPFSPAHIQTHHDLDTDLTQTQTQPPRLSVQRRCTHKSWGYRRCLLVPSATM